MRQSLYGNRCWLCAGEASQIDHVVAVARGGTNWPANLRPICPPCNRSKGSRDWRPYMATASGLPKPTWSTLVAQHGDDIRAIADATGRSLRTVQRWRQAAATQ